MMEESGLSTGISDKDLENNLKNIHFEGIKSPHKVDEWRCRLSVRRKFIDFPFKPKSVSTLPDFVYTPKMDQLVVEKEEHTTGIASIEALNPIGVIAKEESYRSLEAKVFDYFGFEDMIPSYSFTLRDDLDSLLKTIDEERVVNKYVQVVGEVEKGNGSISSDVMMKNELKSEVAVESELQTVHDAAYVSSVEEVPKPRKRSERKKQKVTVAARVSKASKASKASKTKSMPEAQDARKLLPVPMAQKKPIKQKVNMEQMEEKSLNEARLLEMEQREEMKLIQRVQEIERRQKMMKNVQTPHLQKGQKTQTALSWQKKEEKKEVMGKKVSPKRQSVIEKEKNDTNQTGAKNEMGKDLIESNLNKTLTVDSAKEAKPTDNPYSPKTLSQSSSDFHSSGSLQILSCSSNSSSQPVLSSHLPLLSHPTSNISSETLSFPQAPLDSPTYSDSTTSLGFLSSKQASIPSQAISSANHQYSYSQGFQEQSYQNDPLSIQYSSQIPYPCERTFHPEVSSNTTTSSRVLNSPSVESSVLLQNQYIPAPTSIVSTSTLEGKRLMSTEQSLSQAKVCDHSHPSPCNAKVERKGQFEFTLPLQGTTEEEIHQLQSYLGYGDYKRYQLPPVFANSNAGKEDQNTNVKPDTDVNVFLSALVGQKNMKPTSAQLPRAYQHFIRKPLPSIKSFSYVC